MSSKSVQHLIQAYGDLLFDLCESMLWSPVNAQIAFRSIIWDLRKSHSVSAAYREHERSWVLKIACKRLLSAIRDSQGRRITATEHIELGSGSHLSARLKNFDFYFHRLPADDKIVLLFHDKYGLPYPEIASATGMPEGTIKLRRTQALRTLEDWLWDGSAR